MLDPSTIDVASAILDSEVGQGGALAASQLTVSSSTFIGNTAVSGGAVALSGQGSATVRSTVFTSNVCSLSGGGIFGRTGRLTLVRSLEHCVL